MSTIPTGDLRTRVGEIILGILAYMEKLTLGIFTIMAMMLWIFPTVKNRRTGIIRMKRLMHLEFLLLEISTVEIGYSPLVPTAFDIIRPKIPINYWWLRSPVTSTTIDALQVYPVGGVSSGYHVYNGSYGFIRINLSIITEK